MIVGLVDGRFNAIEGGFVVTGDAERLFGWIDVRVDAASVDTKVEARDDDLRSERLFGVGSFPLLMFSGIDCALVGNPCGRSPASSRFGASHLLSRSR